MKIKTTSRSIWGARLIVPIDKEIEIDNEGYAEVSEACANVLLNSTNDWFEEEEDTEEIQEEEDIKSRIENMGMDDLKHLAEEIGIQPEEYAKFKSEKAMRAFLIKKYQNA